MESIKAITKNFVKYLKGVEVSDCICDSCGYRMGHPLKYCTKCPGKMRIILTSEYTYFLRHPYPTKSPAYKFRCARLVKEKYLTQEQWEKVVQEIKKKDTI